MMICSNAQFRSQLSDMFKDLNDKMQPFAEAPWAQLTVTLNKVAEIQIRSTSQLISSGSGFTAAATDNRLYLNINILSRR